MYDKFYNILQPSLKDLQLHYMDTDILVLSSSEGIVPDEHMDNPISKNQSKLKIKFQVNSNMNWEVE